MRRKRAAVHASASTEHHSDEWLQPEKPSPLTLLERSEVSAFRAHPLLPLHSLLFGPLENGWLPRIARVTGSILFVIALLAGRTASAQEFSLLAGPLVSDSESSYSWEATYREGLGRYAAWSLSWLNEGHVPDHHRDGQAVQLWARLPLVNDRFELSAGAGPYRYFDTVAADQGEDYSNTHGWGVVLSLRAAYYSSHRWIAQMQLNSVQAFGERNTTALLFGIGYQLDGNDEPGPRQRPLPRTSNVTNNELTAMYGVTILNSEDSQTAPAETLEYRRGLGRYVDGTISYLHESGHAQIRRDGMAAQLWLTRGFFDDDLTLAAGIGPYVEITRNSDVPDDPLGDGRLAALMSVSASYRLGRHWLARVTWNRVATRYNRDSDILQFGIGVRF